MANVLNVAYKQYLAATWLTDTIKVALLSSAYTYSPSHANYSDLTGVVGTPATVTGKTNTNGVLAAANTLFASLTGSQVTQMWVYRDTGVAGTSTLIAYINVGVNLPFTPSGRDETIEWSSSGIVTL